MIHSWRVGGVMTAGSGEVILELRPDEELDEVLSQLLDLSPEGWEDIVTIRLDGRELTLDRSLWPEVRAGLLDYLVHCSLEGAKEFRDRNGPFPFDVDISGLL